MAIIYGKRERLRLLLLLLLQAPLGTSCSQRQSRAINEFKLENLLDAQNYLRQATGSRGGVATPTGETRKGKGQRRDLRLPA